MGFHGRGFIFKVVFLGMVLFGAMQCTAFAANLTREGETAQKFGVHEISLSGNGAVNNPFDTLASVTFTPPSGNARTVYAFYDGGNTWRARVYADETGEWLWSSECSTDSGLDGKNGTIMVTDSDLPGKLVKHPEDNKALATENGEWFLNISDTAYYLFNDASAQWKEFVRDDWELGVNSLRANLLGNLRQSRKQQASDGWDRVFSDSGKSKMNLSAFQTTDERMEWMLNTYPGMYVQLIVTPEPNNNAGDESYWKALTSVQKERYLRYVVSRYAAFPQVFWLVTNDAHHTGSHPNNTAMVHEVGNYLWNNDPWSDKNLRSSGRNRGQKFYFLNSPWVSYIHIETATALAADQAADYLSSPMHVYNGEDWYEGEKNIPNDSYFFRRLFWAWTLSGGSATYGGEWNKIVAYNTTGFTGLDDIIHLKNFFPDHNISLVGFRRDNNIVSGPAGAKKVVLMKNPEQTEFVLYHPNAASDGGSAAVSGAVAELTLKNLPVGVYSITWLKADDGTEKLETFPHSGGDKTLTAPWSGVDVAAYIKEVEMTETGVGVSNLDFMIEDAPVEGIVSGSQENVNGKAVFKNWNMELYQAVLIMARYSGGQLVEAVASPVTDILGREGDGAKETVLVTPAMQINKMDAGDTLKLFIWKDWNKLIPYRSSKLATVK